MSDETRQTLLRLAWAGVRAWTPDNIANVRAAARAVDAGAVPDDVATAMTAAAFEAVFALLSILDDGGDPDGPPAPQAWAVVSLPHGQPLDGLHEDILGADPTGREGADLDE